jgi:hypothetical protein
MKKIIYSTLLLTLLSQLIFSQNVAQIVSITLPHSNDKLSVDVLLNNRSKNVVTKEDKGWRIGIQFGNSGNISKFSGGMQTANARFNQNVFQAPNIDVVARYDFNKHWMLMTGVGFNDIGFGYSISENYSLAKTKIKSSDLKTDFVAMELPIAMFYKFKPNCKNNSWIIGAGFVPTITEKQSTDKEFSIINEGSSVNNISSHSVSNGEAAVLLRWSIAREKLFSNGSILQASFIVNMGYKTMATSTVNYTLDNQNYSHSFSNNGSSVGFRLAYFLKPLSK